MNEMETEALPSQVVRWHRVADEERLLSDVQTRVLAAAERALRERSRFVIVLAGGNTPRGLYERLRDAVTDWSRWQVWFGDERCAPSDDPERNSRMAQIAWLDHVPIPRLQVHPIPAELGAGEAARRYMAAVASVDLFDIVLLGLGEDGHTASLFPGHDAGTAEGSPTVLPVLAAPKPPPERVSLSAWRLSRSRETIFMVSGESKRSAVDRWRAGAAIPAAAIAPRHGVDVFVEAALLAGREAPDT